MTSASTVVVHNASAQRFELHTQGHVAQACYRLEAGEGGSQAVLVATHTGVPVPLQGQGLAGQLVQALLDHARRNQLKVRPQCSYVAAYLRRHPNEQEGVT